MEICTNKHPPTIVSEGNSLTIALDVVADNDFAFTFDLKAAYSVIDNGTNNWNKLYSKQNLYSGNLKVFLFSQHVEVNSLQLADKLLHRAIRRGTKSNYYYLNAAEAA